MADATELEVSSENITKKDPEVEGRINNLTSKLRTVGAEKEEALAAKAEAEAKAAEAQKDLEFYKDFSNVSIKFPGASEFQDQIREKVRAGYSMDDAALTALAAAGKYQPPTVEQAPIVQPHAAGGSADTIIPSTGNKTPSQMNSDELRAAMEEAVRRGDIGLS